MSNKYEELRDEILHIAYEHESTGTPELIEASRIAQRLGLTTQEVDEQLEILEVGGYVKLVKGVRGNHSARLQPLGKQRVKEGLKPMAITPQYIIGAIIHSMSGGTVQAVGLASHTEVSQIVNDPEMLRSQVEDLTNQLVEAVKGTLMPSELTAYIKAVEGLQDQLLSSEPNPSRVKRLLGTLAFLADVEGTIDLMVRVWPYISSLLMIAAIILRALPR
jgi:hypothetical protein